MNEAAASHWIDRPTSPLEDHSVVVPSSIQLSAMPLIGRRRGIRCDPMCKPVRVLPTLLWVSPTNQKLLNRLGQSPGRHRVPLHSGRPFTSSQLVGDMNWLRGRDRATPNNALQCHSATQNPPWSPIQQKDAHLGEVLGARSAIVRAVDVPWFWHRSRYDRY
jgi:hypothetical protein